jgi:beta-mannanase
MALTTQVIKFDAGDEYVDWVGLSVYWYPDAGTGFNGPVPPTFFRDYVQGNGPTVEQFNPTVLQDGGLRNFYRRFALERNKPMMIPETSAPYFDFITTGTRTETEIKQAWWTQLYSQETRALFPKLKAIIHFEERKADADSEIRDWRILANPSVRDAFVTDMNAIRRQVLFANDMKYECDGSITVNYAAN